MFGNFVHRIQRNQNQLASLDFRIGTRYNPFKNTLQILEDPKQGRRLFLIGSTHASTLLAHRTRELIRQEKPDSVFVQTNTKWWDTVKHFEGVENQQQFNQYVPDLWRTYTLEMDYKVRNFRYLVFWYRFYIWAFQMQWVTSFPRDFNPLVPGLEVKYAIEEAQAQNAKVHFGGMALNESDLLSLKTETRMDAIILAWNYYKMVFDVRWQREAEDLRKVLSVQGGEGFAECLDRYRANWYVKAFEKLSPNQKRILIDKKDVDIFKTLYRDLPGKTIVAVVNQWHMDGIEYYWRQQTGTRQQFEPINPIGDMDLEAYHEDNLINDYLRQFVSRLTHSEPATSRNYITQYFKDCQESERFRHVEFSSHDDPHMLHGTPYDGGFDFWHKKLPKEEQLKLAAKLEEKKDHHGGHH